jgi:xylitol oxidase
MPPRMGDVTSDEMAGEGRSLGAPAASDHLSDTDFERIEEGLEGLAEPDYEVNWARNYRYKGRIARPQSVDALREVISSSQKVGFLGSRHSFNAIADSDVLVDMRSLPESIDIDVDRRIAMVSGGTTYGTLAQELDRHGMALANFASLPHITVAGAIASGTHGSGTENGGLGTSVMSLELITADAKSVYVERGHADFAGCVVGLGALGAVVRVGVNIEPAYTVRQFVMQDVPWSSVARDLRAVMSSAYSVSLFTRWDDSVSQAWVKQRVADDSVAMHPALADGRPAETDLHPVGDLDTANCTPQLGVEGPSFDRLPHFRIGFTPSSGEELQSEFLVDWSAATDAVEAMRAIGDRIRPALLISEVRAVAGDELWMSPSFGRDSLAIHFTWRPEPELVEAALTVVESVLLPLGARPHWGKVFLAESDDIRDRYPKLEEFSALAERFDPDHAFRNAWLERHVFGSSDPSAE